MTTQTTRRTLEAKAKALLDSKPISLYQLVIGSNLYKVPGIATAVVTTNKSALEELINNFDYYYQQWVTNGPLEKLPTHHILHTLQIKLREYLYEALGGDKRIVFKTLEQWGMSGKNAASTGLYCRRIPTVDWFSSLSPENFVIQLTVGGICYNLGNEQALTQAKISLAELIREQMIAQKRYMVREFMLFIDNHYAIVTGGLSLPKKYSTLINIHHLLNICLWLGMREFKITMAHKEVTINND